MTTLQTQPTELWYFAYGSNMQRATFEGRRGMRPRQAVHGRLHGYRVSFDLPVGPGERGVANLSVDAMATTHGVLYLLTADDFDRLDRTEGVDKNFYRRLRVDVIDRDERAVEAWTYVSPHAQRGRKPSARYLCLLLDGAAEHGLPEAYVRELRALQLAVDERLEP